MAPEIEDLKSGAGISYGYPADLWSVGVVLYMLLMFDFPRFEDSDKRSRLLVLVPPTSWGRVPPSFLPCPFISVPTNLPSSAFFPFFFPSFFFSIFLSFMLSFFLSLNPSSFLFSYFLLISLFSSRIVISIAEHVPESQRRMLPSMLTRWMSISSAAQQMVLGLLDKNPSTRLTPAQVLDHPWMRMKS